jgi:hypothetical protein
MKHIRFIFTALLLMIGNNNVFFTPETGVESVAQGIFAALQNYDTMANPRSSGLCSMP